MIISNNSNTVVFVSQSTVKYVDILKSMVLGVIQCTFGFRIMNCSHIAEIQRGVTYNLHQVSNHIEARIVLFLN